jgi:hypothetical protein
MSARSIRRTFAAPFVLTIACGKSEPPAETKPPAPALRLFEIQEERREACVAKEICPPKAACTPAKPYAFPCNTKGRYTTIDNKKIPIGKDFYSGEEQYDPRDEIAKLADGTCRSRAETCTALDCLGAPTPCPPDKGIAMAPQRWTITRSGTTCTAQPLPVTTASHTDEPVPYPCPADADVIGVAQYYTGKCAVDNHAADPPHQRDVTSSFNPPEPRYVECPRGAKNPKSPY